MEILNKVLYKLHLKKPPRKPPENKDIIPGGIKEVLEEKQLDTSEAVFSFKTDMSGAEEYGDVFIFFDPKGIYKIRFKVTDYTQKKDKKKKTDFKPEITSIVAIPIDEIDEIHTEQYLATGQLTYTYKGEYHSLGYFSIGLLERADNFRKIFNAVYGVSPVSYINSLRITRARELLETKMYSAREVCFLSGFGDESHFSRKFKKATGLPPSKYN